MTASPGASAGPRTSAPPGRIGRIEAVDERTVRFTLCTPDGAFPARLAHPALGIMDAAEVDVLARDPSTARSIAGAGAYRVEAWIPGENVRLVRVAAAGGAGDTTATVILRWDPVSGTRLDALREGLVDGIDLPDGAEVDAIDTLPELVRTDRDGLSTAYLGFGSGATFAAVAVRKAFAQGVDRDALAVAGFPPGSTAATHVAPCAVPGGCAGDAWYETNGPAGAAALDAAKFDRKTALPLYVPDAPVPGLPDPAALAEAVRTQLADNLGVTVTVTPMPAADLTAAVAGRRLRGLYLAGLVSTLPDASGFLEPLFGVAAPGMAAGRADGVAAALTRAAASQNVAARQDAFAAANDAIRTTVPIVPLVHAGSTMAFRDDVTGVATSPLGTEALGTFVPGDRRQLVVMQDAEPAGAWCGTATAFSDFRLCALVTPGLYAYAPGTTDPVPALASRCLPVDGTMVWSCRLRADALFSDGAHVDAGDVVATFQALGDPESALRAGRPALEFAAWDALFGSASVAGIRPPTAP